MNRKFLGSALCFTMLATAGCTGMREADGLYTVHAESFRIFGYAIPGDDQAAAAMLHKQHFDGTMVTSSCSTPADWTSFCGVLGNLFGFHSTVISGKK